MSPTTADYIHRCVQHSLVLLSAIHAELLVNGRPDLARVVEMAQGDATAADQAACILVERAQHRKDQRILFDLRALARLGGSQAIPIAVRLARRVAER